jgi:carbon-monoxide dehydrogenase small subunit
VAPASNERAGSEVLQPVRRQADSATITTIEGSPRTTSASIQQGFWESTGSSAASAPRDDHGCQADAERYPKPSEELIRHQLDGNLCRCTGYHNIVKAIEWAAEHMAAK